MPSFQSLFADQGDPFMPYPQNTPTPDDLPALSVADIAALPVEVLAILQHELEERLKHDKAIKTRFDAALAARYSERASEARRACGKDTGTVRLADGDHTVVADLPKRVSWDQATLATIAQQIAAGGQDPSEFIETTLKVPERQYTALPADWRRMFDRARTVGSGTPSIRLEVGEPS